MENRSQIDPIMKDRSALLENERSIYKNSKHLEFYNKKGDARQIFAHEQVRKCLLKALQARNCSASSKVLNLACGTGEMDMEYILPLTQKITGIDITFEALEIFKKRFQLPCAEGDVLHLPFKDKSFDFVVCSGLLHHLIAQGGLRPFITEFKRVLRPGGWLISNEPNLFFPNGFPMLILQKIKPGIMGLVPGERPLSPFHMSREYKKCDFKNVSIEASSFVYNRFPLFLSKAIARSEDKIRHKSFFRLFGWWTLICGQS